MVNRCHPILLHVVDGVIIAPVHWRVKGAGDERA
jgi:hypothetical protein